MKDRLKARQRMIGNHLKARGIKAFAVLAAMTEVPWGEFLPEAMAEFAYEYQFRCFVPAR